MDDPAPGQRILDFSGTTFSNLGGIEMKFPKFAHLRKIVYASIRYIEIMQPEFGQSGESGNHFDCFVGNPGFSKIKPFEHRQICQLRSGCIGDRVATQAQVSQLFHLAKMNHRLIGDPALTEWQEFDTFGLRKDAGSCVSNLGLIKVQPLKFGQP